MSDLPLALTYLIYEELETEFDEIYDEEENVEVLSCFDNICSFVIVMDS